MTSTDIGIGRLLLGSDDTQVRQPAPKERCLRHRKGATMSMPQLLLRATAIGQTGPRDRARRRDCLSAKESCGS